MMDYLSEAFQTSLFVSRKLDESQIREEVGASFVVESFRRKRVDVGFEKGLKKYLVLEF